MKQTLRKDIRHKIAQMTEAEKMSQSLCICQQIEATIEWQQAYDVMLYAALADEVSLSRLIADACARGKRVWLPVVDGDNLIIRRYQDGKTAISDSFHIEEPTADAPELEPGKYDRLALAIIPGRAFTRDGVRLGRGKGYYDRFLAHYQGLTIGVGFSCQICDTLPADKWDKKVDRVVTVEKTM